MSQATEGTQAEGTTTPTASATPVSNGKAKTRRPGDNSDIMQWVEKKFNRNNDVKASDLYEEAKKEFGRRIGRLDVRQFHAQFLLQIKRRANAGSTSRKRGAGRSARAVAHKTLRRGKQSGGTPARGAARHQQRQESMRNLFLDFGNKLLAAQDKGQMFGIAGTLDQYSNKALDI